MKVAIALLCLTACASTATSSDISAEVYQRARTEGMVRRVVDICFHNDSTRRSELIQLSDAYLQALSAASAIPLQDLQMAAKEGAESASQDRSTIYSQCRNNIDVLEAHVKERQGAVERLLSGGPVDGDVTTGDE